MYNLKAPDTMTREKLTEDKDFIKDARDFLIDREGYSIDDMSDVNNVYDQYMEHFRYQNVNEVTAIRDYNYVQDADEEGKQRFGRLMDTFDKMDSDFGLDAAQDYLGGVFTAPSTYAGMFSFGAGKAASLAGQQGIKWGIREAIKSGAKTAGAGSLAVEATAAGATTLANEASRVEGLIKDEIDYTNVGLSTALGAGVGGVLGTFTGMQRSLAGNAGSMLARTSELKSQSVSELAHSTTTKAVFDDEATKKTANTVRDVLYKVAEERATKEAQKGKKPRMASLSETIPENLKAGETVRIEKGVTFSAKQMDNISAAVAKIDNLIDSKAPGLQDQLPDGVFERVTSRFTRGLELVDVNELSAIMKAHNVTMEELVSVYPTMVSESARILGQQSGRAKKLAKAEAAAFKSAAAQLDELDVFLLKQGLDPADYSKAARKQIQDESGQGMLTKAGSLFTHIAKARVGLMTVKLNTTIRNTTNGYMRNYIYAMDNFGGGFAYLAKGSAKKLLNPTDKMAQLEANRATRMGVAMLKTGGEASLLKDLKFGMESYSTNALFKLLANEDMGKQKVAQKLLKQMGDVADLTGTEGGLIGVSRTLNTLNSMSDNMFKRAIFAREVDKAIRAKPVQKTKEVDIVRPDGVRITSVKETYKNLDEVLKAGEFQAIDDDVFTKAMDEAFDFTYQTGNFASREGGFNKLAAGIINVFSTPLGSAFVPFPRYMVNQLRFAYEHAPVFGLINLGGISNKSGGKAGVVGTSIGMDSVARLNLTPEAIGKQIGGLTTLGTFMGLRYNYGDATTGPFEYRDITSGNKFDARASIGPFSAYAWFADLMYRKNIGGYVTGIDTPVRESTDVFEEAPVSVRDFVQIFTGGQGRAGTGLDVVDGAVNIVLEGIDNDTAKLDALEDVAAKFVGNYINTFFIGAGMLKDVVATLDADYRVLPDNNDVNVWDYIFKQATKSFPIAPDAEAELEILPENRDKRIKSGSIYKSGGNRKSSPIVGMLTGLMPQEPSSFVKDELDRLSFDYMELTPRRIKTDASLSNQARDEMGKMVERELASYIASSAYKNIPTNVEKRVVLKKQISILRTLARDKVMNPERAGRMVPAEQEYLLKIQYMNLSNSKKQVRKARYKNEFPGRNLEDDEAWGYE